YARKHIPATLGICWGALGIAAFLGIPREDYKKKLFGVYETDNLVDDHHIMGAMDDTFWCPQSRHSGVADEMLELEREKGALNLLAYAPGVGYVMAETADQRFLMHFGNPEYEASTLVEQYTHDKEVYGNKAAEPDNFDMTEPVNRWRGHRTALFQEWIRQIHESTTY
ncbi:MAG: homoserine O-acetyltransferase/O-succinyltransferase family protein, partial [Chitinivibrionales bacterium]